MVNVGYVIWVGTDPSYPGATLGTSNGLLVRHLGMEAIDNNAPFMWVDLNELTVAQSNSMPTATFSVNGTTTGAAGGAPGVTLQWNITAQP
jgi:hypothetical protein